MSKQIQCLYCGQYFKDPAILNSIYGICPECKEHPRLGKTCNSCGQDISLYEYDSNIYGYCEDCLDEYMEENE